MTDERDRQAILARRRFFVASALAGLAVSQCDRPQPCLNVAAPLQPDAGAPREAAAPAPAPAPTPSEAAPKPCLEYAPPEPDAAAAVPKQPPTAATQPKPPPQPCLKIAVPRDLEKKR